MLLSILQEVCKFACLLHNPSTADYRKWLAPGACFDLGCRCGPKAVGGEGVVGAIEEGMAAVSCHDYCWHLGCILLKTLRTGLRALRSLCKPQATFANQRERLSCASIPRFLSR